jgi:hypothetical protein
MRAQNFADTEPQSARTEWVWRPQADDVRLPLATTAEIAAAEGGLPPGVGGFFRERVQDDV